MQCNRLILFVNLKEMIEQKRFLSLKKTEETTFNFSQNAVCTI